MLPRWDRKAGLQSAFFFISLLLASYLTPLVQHYRHPISTFGWIFAFVISISAAPTLFLFSAIGMAKAQFWRALWNLFTKPRDNYPFSSLLGCIDHDLRQHKRFERFANPVLQAAEQRIHLEESELRERLNATVGTPNIFVFLGSVAGAATAWINYTSHPDSWVNGGIFALSLVMIGLGLYGSNLRISLMELSRCRALLTLEIARRGKHTQPNTSQPKRARKKQRR